MVRMLRRRAGEVDRLLAHWTRLDEQYRAVWQATEGVEG